MLRVTHRAYLRAVTRPVGILPLLRLRRLIEQLFRRVRAPARHATHLQFDISATAFEIKATQSPKSIV
jgi:hypothetical protein